MARLISALAIAAAADDMLSAQSPDGTGPGSEAIRVGVVWMDPRFRVSNVGVDTNVFNEIEDPKQDFTATASTGVDLWLRTGRGQFAVVADTEFVYFETYDSERSLNIRGAGSYEYQFNRVRPFVFASMNDTKERPTDEINARVRTMETTTGAGVNLRMLAKGTVRLEFSDTRFEFEDDAVYDGVSLHQQLDHDRRGVEARWQQQLTALTTLVLRLSRDREQFPFAPERDAANYRVSTGFELGQFALIRGIANVGYHVLRAERPDLLPEYAGLTADVDVAYTAPTQTRFQAFVKRELQQSYDVTTPHYTQLEYRGTVTQKLFGRWDIQLVAGRSRQDYEGTSLAAARVDKLDRIGGGIGYTMANHLRASIDILSMTRMTDIPGQSYSGAVGGFSVTYGY